MTPYLFTFGSFLAVYVALEVTPTRPGLQLAQRWMLLLPLMAFSAIYAGYIGTDNDQYSILFDRAEDFPIEPGFSMLMSGAKSLGLDYVGFAKVLAIVQMLLLASIVKRLRDPLFFLLFYVGSFYLNFHFNQVRIALALLIVGTIYVRLRRPSVVSLLSASVIHYSSVMTMGLQWLAVSKRQVLAIGAIVVAAGLFAVLWQRPELAGGEFGALAVYQAYLGQEYEGKSIYFALLLKLFLVWIFYLNGGSRFYLIVYAILVVMAHLISPILARISDLVLFLAVLDFCLRYQLGRYRLAALGVAMLLVASGLLIPWNDCQRHGEENWCLSGGKLQKP